MRMCVAMCRVVCVSAHPPHPHARTLTLTPAQNQPPPHHHHPHNLQVASAIGKPQGYVACYDETWNRIKGFMVMYAHVLSYRDGHCVHDEVRWEQGCGWIVVGIAFLPPLVD